MTRSEGAGVAIAVVVHAGLFLWLSLVFLTPAPLPHNEPIEVSLTDEVGLQSQAPNVSHEKLAAKLSPVEAPVEPDEAPPEPDEQPKPVAKVKPAPAKPAPAPDAQKPQPPTATDSRGRRRPDKPVTPTGNLTGLLDGKSNNKTDSHATTPPATMTGAATQSIASAIARQVQPCADRQVSPAPEAQSIRVTVRLTLNRDGSLTGGDAIRIVDHDGVNDGNTRYVRRVDDAVRAIFAGCSPLRDLPAELYDVPNGWHFFTLRYRLKPQG